MHSDAQLRPLLFRRAGAHGPLGDPGCTWRAPLGMSAGAFRFREQRWAWRRGRRSRRKGSGGRTRLRAGDGPRGLSLGARRSGREPPGPEDGGRGGGEPRGDRGRWGLSRSGARLGGPRPGLSCRGAASRTGEALGLPMNTCLSWRQNGYPSAPTTPGLCGSRSVGARESRLVRREVLRDVGSPGSGPSRHSTPVVRHHLSLGAGPRRHDGLGRSRALPSARTPVRPLPPGPSSARPDSPARPPRDLSGVLRARPPCWKRPSCSGVHLRHPATRPRAQDVLAGFNQ